MEFFSIFLYFFIFFSIFEGCSNKSNARTVEVYICQPCQMIRLSFEREKTQDSPTKNGKYDFFLYFWIIFQLFIVMSRNKINPTAYDFFFCQPFQALAFHLGMKKDKFYLQKGRNGIWFLFFFIFHYYSSIFDDL